MKVGNTPPFVPPGDSGDKLAVDTPSKIQEGGFAATLEEVSGPEASARPEELSGPEASPKGPGAHRSDAAALAAAVDSGQVSPAEAVRMVVDHVLATQLPPDASAELRSKVRALVESSLQNDPLLVSLVGRLGGGR